MEFLAELISSLIFQMNYINQWEQSPNFLNVLQLIGSHITALKFKSQLLPQIQSVLLCYSVLILHLSQNKNFITQFKLLQHQRNQILLQRQLMFHKELYHATSKSHHLCSFQICIGYINLFFSLLSSNTGVIQEYLKQ